MKEQRTPYTIQHVPAHHGSGRYDEHWTLDAMASGHGLTTHPTREAAQVRADELFGPTPLATLTIKVFADRTQVHAVAKKGAEPRKVLDQGIAALQAEISDLAACPFHTPSQRLDAATVERDRDAWKDRARSAANSIDALLLYATGYPTDSHALDAYALLMQLRQELGMRGAPRTVDTFARHAAGRSVMPPLSALATEPHQRETQS